MSDELWALLRRWKEGDQEAGSRVIDEVFPRVARFFRNKVTRVPDDDDLTQKTMLALLRATPRADSTSFWGLVYGIARNVLREYVREKTKRVREQSDFASVCVHELDRRSMSSMAVRSRELRALVEGLRRLPLEHQILLELRFFEGMAAAEISEVLQIPRGSVHRQVQSGVDKLRDAVADLLGVSEDPDASPSAAALQAWAERIRQQLG